MNMNQQSSPKIGFIGLGRMGLGMASNLQRKGFALVVHDLNKEAVAALVKLGAQPASSVAEAARRCDIVVTMLPNSAIVDAVVGGADGVLANIARGALVMDMSTVEPEVTDRLAAAALAQGKSFVDAPVGRLASHADRGESLFMVGGAEADFQRVLPLLQAMGSTIHHCGEVGAGTRTKLVNNYLAVVSCQLNAEALTLSQRFGLSLEKTLEVLYGTTATNGQLKIAWPDKVLKGDIAPGFTIDLAHKDLTLIVNAANTAKSPMPIGAAAKEAFSTARARGFGGNDFSAMVDVLCDLSNTEKPRLKQ
ncbi:NAD(P)-binding domain-containing protein [Herbaspirillum sp. WKF16]|uniref:NAD(P)-dependent oxidoreductase n=1 Tax=Herbaspirillum sp. WKF16 TaxID=3028312 RepID=UPI0023A9D48A|nr:NAD(P)-binding domain-containing protein [Herbaspirillum sp. WKF16]WDZ94963.1 NAD(P)-binding domain-containing protein [Herbaspirillum sp. WKF16]